MSAVTISDLKGQRIHLVGIGGASMSGLAEMLNQAGYLVSGSDSAENYAVRRLRQLGLDVQVGHHPEMVAGAGLLVYSAAIAPTDQERMAATEQGIPQMERAVLLGQLMQTAKRQLCVAGTHGKTTTSSMIAQILSDTGLDPTVHLGGSLDAIGGSVRIGGNELFVAEACEFNRSFHHMPVSFAVLLNIEEDHLDCYGTMEQVEEAYLHFLEQLPDDGTILALGTDERIKRVLSRLAPKNRQVFTFSEETGDFTFSNLAYDQKGNASFEVHYQDKTLGQVSLSVPGYYNALHALCALATAHLLNVPFVKAAASLSRFTGAHRRFEFTGTVQGMDLYHDYGHNPAEMRVAVDMAKLQNKRVIAVMQPHTYSRVKTLFSEYLTCTKAADITLVTDIFAAREKDPGDINTKMLIEGMREHGVTAHHTPDFDQTEEWLLKYGQPGDLVITMGCGNINLLNEQMQKNFSKTAKSKTEETWQ